jgi:hypothetical protein
MLSAWAVADNPVEMSMLQAVSVLPIQTNLDVDPPTIFTLRMADAAHADDILMTVQESGVIK